jgi:hypothetical protein
MVIENLKKQMKPLKVSECARFLGMSATNLTNRIEAGKFPMRAVIRIADAIRIDPHKLAETLEADGEQ